MTEIGKKQTLAVRLIVLSRLISRQSSRFLNNKFNLSMAEWLVLGHLDTLRPLRLHELADITHADKAQLSRASGTLIQRGLVRKEFDLKDGRSVFFWLTEKGHEIKDLANKSAFEFDQRLTRELTEGEHELLSATIDKLTQDFEMNIEAV